MNNYQMAELNRLKAWLYRQRTQVRMENDRIERRQKREEETERRIAEQRCCLNSKDGPPSEKGAGGDSRSPLFYQMKLPGKKVNFKGKVKPKE